MRRRSLSIPVALAAFFFSSVASATTYQVGSARTYKNLGAVADKLTAGDIVEVDGGETYPAVTFEKAGTAAAKITIRGVKVGGKRPIISGGTNSIEASGDHYVFEGLEITAGSSRCFYHHADDVTLRDSVVHDCPAQGILGADNDSGSFLLEYSEVYGCGASNPEKDHQIYMATDESAHPGSVFRMQFCYVHDGKGGNNVKSRAERNEIYYNWIENAHYHELELIGPDPSGGVDADLKREDSDVVGNVLKKGVDFAFVRTGGDGTGESNGRYRFVNNTFIGAGSASTAFRMFDGLDSIEMHDNVFWRSGGTFDLTRTVEAVFDAGRQVAGQNNWILTGAPEVPAEWTGTLEGADPGFTDPTNNDYSPKVDSPLVDKGTTTTTGPAGHDFPSPLARPLFHPPRRALIAPGTAVPRPVVGPIDIGAFEFGVGPAADPDGGTDPAGDGGASSSGSSGGSSGSSGSDGAGAAPSDDSGDGGGCHVTSGRGADGALGLSLLALVLLRRRSPRTGRSRRRRP